MNLRLLPRLLLMLVAVCAAGSAWARVELRIEGIDDELLANTRAYIGPREEIDRMSFRALAQHATDRTREALQALGHYRPVINASRETAGDKVICVLVVDAGPPLPIAAMDVEMTGGGHEELAEFIEKNAPRSGDVFHHGAYETFKTQLLQTALMLGYFDARYATQEARVDLTKYEARILLSLATGERHRIGDITVHGEGIAPALVSRFPRFASGDWYNAGKIAELHRDLVRAGWFESVKIVADPDPLQPQVVPVTIDYTPRKKNRVGLGAGFSTDVGPRIKAQWEKPWLNAKGHSLGTYAEFSGVRSQLEASYTIPLRDPVTSQLAWTYGLQFEDLNDYDYWLTTAGVEHRKRLGSGWRLTRGLQLERETDDFGLTETSSTLLMPGITLSRTDSEGSPLITRGWRAVVKLQGASRSLISDADMLRLSFNGKAVHSLGERTRAIVRLGAGAMQTPDMLDIPVSLRFFAGGDQSVRGYDYRSIGPIDGTGTLIGGRYNLEGSAEFDVRVTDRWLLAAFADTGTAFDDSPDFFNGIGAGIRWLSPIGPLRLDFAWGTSLPQNSFNVHFYMGPEL